MRQSCIIIPSILSNSALDIAELESDSSRLSEIYALSLTSKGKHIPPRTWQQKLKRDDWMQHLSGRTCSTSRMENFEDWWISRLRESRASHIVTQDYARGGGDERFLFDDWLRGLQQMRPRCILIENVEGLLTSQMPDGTLCIRWTLERLERMGYRTASGIFSAEECGAPHIRKRVWILAYADGERGQGSECFLRDACQIGQGRKDSAADSDIGDAWKWPSGPDEPQRWWEPARTIESSMGRKSARSAVVLDRLRLLGNGVVPATAALAFRTLARELLV